MDRHANNDALKRWQKQTQINFEPKQFDFMWHSIDRTRIQVNE